VIQFSLLDRALAAFIDRNEITLANGENSLLITDVPLGIVTSWRGTVLTSHRSVRHRNAVTALPVNYTSSETVVCLSPIAEVARWQIDLAKSVTRGNLIAFAENRRGAERLVKLVEDDGVQVEAFAREHCRAVLAAVRPPDNTPVPALAAQPIAGWDDLVALPGTFGATRADRGSELLLGCALSRITEDRTISSVCDLGCGCGVLGVRLLQRNPNLKVDFIDVDYRAVQSTKINLASRNFEPSGVYWLDALTEPLPNSRYDLVLLNPPFHAYGQEDRELGRRIIELALTIKAHEILIVGNSHLGYAKLLLEGREANGRLSFQELVKDKQFSVWSVRGSNG
jgi:16S rRNA G1207 methylase RsmC